MTNLASRRSRCGWSSIWPVTSCCLASGWRLQSCSGRRACRGMWARPHQMKRRN